MDWFTRRDALRAIGASAVVGLAGCQTGATDDLCGRDPPDVKSTIPTATVGSVPDLSSDAAWPTYQHDAGRTGYSDDAGPTAGVRLAWSRTVGDGRTWPVVAGGTVVVSDSGEGVLAALSSADGSIEWSVEDPVRATQPTVVEDAVVVGDRSGLHAYELATGRKRWTFALEPDARPTESPWTPVDETSDGTADGRSEEPPTDVRDAVRFHAAPTYADGTVLVRSGVGVHALSPDGTERWRREQMHLGAVSGGTAYLLGAPGMVAVDVRSGTERWSREGSGMGPDLVVSDGTVYGDVRDGVAAIDAETGETEWTFEGESEEFASPTVTPDAVFAASSPTKSEDGGNLYALDRETGESDWCTYLGFRSVNSPAATGDAVFVTTEDLVEARATDDGTRRWRYGAESTVFQAPAVADGLLLVGTDDGAVLAFAEQ